MSAEHGLEAILLQGATVAADGQSTGVDCLGYDGIVGVLVAGTICGAGAESTITVESCATQGGSYVATAAQVVQAVNSAVCEIVWFDINPLERWIRVDHATTGTYSSIMKIVLIGRKK